MSPAATMPHATNTEGLQRPPSSSPRWRSIPPPLDLSNAEDPPELEATRTEKLGRRESRLGLRSIFGRSKNGGIPNGPTSPRFSKPSRESLTQGIPYHTLAPGKPTARSQVSRPLSTTLEDAPAPEENPSLPDEPPKRKSGPSNKPKGGAASWDTAPLHKAYPQAARYSTLPAASVPADLILRNHERKVAEASATDDGDQDKPKRRQKRSRAGTISDFEWTTKTYILLATGHLLEYAGEGPFDRQPEKVLRLSRSSAAFASDLIPGRHWVLQVASAMGSEGNSVDSRTGFFSRLPFRGGDKRSVANMLLVFESAEDMDEWLASLRRTVEALGGKKVLSETGKPKTEQASTLREQTSQRTLVVHDSDQGSRSTGHHSWGQDFERRESDASYAPTEATREQSMDGMSATNSIVSQDGQQLESLRSSAHRLSCISSGQRTMITSAGSSPACSPTAESFPLSSEDPQRRHLDVGSVDSRLRPNASDIVNRRKSMQTMSPSEEEPESAPERPFRPQSTLVQGLSPNFSVPSSSSRRFSTRLNTESPPPPLSPPRELDAPSRSLSRRPPTALRISRPLSMVMDQPSPREDIPERPATRHGETAAPAEPEMVPLPPSRPASRVQHSRTPTPMACPSGVPKHMSSQTSPRRFSSMGALREDCVDSIDSPTVSFDPSRMRPYQPHNRSLDPERCHSSVDTYERNNALCAPPVRVNKRVSMLPFIPDQVPPNSAHTHPPPAPPPSIPLPPVPKANGRLRPTSNGHALLNRRSMPQLVEGPPPMPPPTCALPPIPKKHSKGNFF